MARGAGLVRIDPGSGAKASAYRNEDDILATPVVLIAGDGIGPEVSAATQAVVSTAGAQIQWVGAAAGLAAVEKHSGPLPAATLDLIRRHRIALKGPRPTQAGQGYRSTKVLSRQAL